VSDLGYAAGLEYSLPGFLLDLSGQDPYAHAPLAFAAGANPTVNPRDLDLDVPVVPELAMSLWAQALVGLGVAPIPLDPVPDMFHQGMAMYDGAGLAPPTDFLCAGSPLPTSALNLDAPASQVALFPVSHASEI
jgi:hypothetical protein